MKSGEKFFRSRRNRSIWRFPRSPFQFVNDLPGVLTQIRRALRPDGLLLAAMLAAIR